MIFGHNCKVKSRHAVQIDKTSFNNFRDMVDGDEFLNGIKVARNQLYGSEYHEDRRVYQQECTLDMKRNIFGLLMIPIVIRNTTYRFIIDTGAQISAIKETLANELNLPETQGVLHVGSIGGTQKAMRGVFIDTLWLGKIEYKQLPVVCLRDEDFSIRFGKLDVFMFDGLIGWDILHELDFEIDDIRKKFIILKNRLHIPYPNMLQGSFPCFVTQLEDGSHALYGFDSGSKVSWIGEDAIQAHHYPVAGETTSYGYGVHGVEKIDIKIVEHCTLLLDKAQIHLFNTMSGRVKLFPSFAFDGVFGNEICKGRRMRIINSAGMVLIA